MLGAGAQEESAGKVMSLLSNDAQRVMEAVVSLDIVCTPFFIAAVLAMLWHQVSQQPQQGCGMPSETLAQARRQTA